MATASTGLQRVVVGVVLLVAGILSLPISAALLDDEGSENWIGPVQLFAMAVLGAVVGGLLPGFVDPDAGRGRGAVIGAVVGVGMAIVGLGLFFVLLVGFSVD